MKKMMPCPHSFNIAVVTTFPIVVYYYLTKMHPCPILVLIDMIVNPRFVSDT